MQWSKFWTAWICLQPENWHNLKAFFTFTIPYQHDQHWTIAFDFPTICSAVVDAEIYGMVGKGPEGPEERMPPHAQL